LPWTALHVKALCIGEGGTLDIAEVPKPQAQPGEVLVRIAASGLNRADVLQRKGLYPPPPSAPANIPGLEFAGVVESVGTGVSRVAPGQRVFGLCSGGAHAEYIASAEDLLMNVPDSMSDIEAGAIPEAYITAHDALVVQAALQRGERVLIHAIGSGVGLAALQTAQAKGCKVFGTSRNAYKRKRVEALGAHLVCAPEIFDEEILRTTDGVDVILDPVGGPYFERNLRVLASLGRLVIIATMGGTKAELPLAALMRKRLRLIGTMLRSRSLEEKVAATAAFSRDVLPKLAAGELRVIVDRIFPMSQSAQAYDFMEQNKNLGKIVLTI
jgi:putative PIG3 family NAD(P)H quinone oxidoreductase